MVLAVFSRRQSVTFTDAASRLLSPSICSKSMAGRAPLFFSEVYIVSTEGAKAADIDAISGGAMEPRSRRLVVAASKSWVTRANSKHSSARAQAHVYGVANARDCR
jgi:hypothetical protein